MESLFEYFASLNVNSKTLVGYAADGFGIYYSPDETSSYHIKSGDRPGDGVTAPSGEYNGLYTADYEYDPNLRILVNVMRSMMKRQGGIMLSQRNILEYLDALLVLLHQILL